MTALPIQPHTGVCMGRFEHSSDGLNPRQRAFVQHYIAGADGVRGNATAAYRAAGYTPRTDTVAAITASQLLRNPKVAAAIRRYHAQADAAAIAKLRDWK